MTLMGRNFPNVASSLAALYIHMYNTASESGNGVSNILLQLLSIFVQRS